MKHKAPSAVFGGSNYGNVVGDQVIDTMIFGPNGPCVTGCRVGQVIHGSLHIGSQTITMDGGRITIDSGGGPVIQGSGRSATEQRPIVGAPTRIVVESGQVEIAIGGSPCCEVSADDNVLSIVQTEVDGDTLRIDLAGSAALQTPVTVRVTLPELDRIIIKGCGSASVAGVHCDRFRAKVSGSGSVTLRGTTEHFQATVSGVGSVDASGLQARAVHIAVSGNGDVQALAAEEAEVELSGIGEIRIVGNPAKRSVEKSGLGSVRWL